MNSIIKHIIDDALLPSISSQVSFTLDRILYHSQAYVLSKMTTPVCLQLASHDIREFMISRCEEINIPLISQVLQVLSTHSDPSGYASLKYSRANAVQIMRSLLPIRKGKDKKPVIIVDRSRIGEISIESYTIVRYHNGHMVIPKALLGTTPEHIENAYHHSSMMIFLFNIDVDDLANDIYQFTSSRSTLTVNKVYYYRFSVHEHVASSDDMVVGQAIIPAPTPLQGNGVNKLQHALKSASARNTEPQWGDRDISSRDVTFHNKACLDYALSKGNTIVGIDPSEIHFPSIEEGGFRGAFYPKEIMDIVEDIRLLLSKADWYASKGVAINMGILLHGPAGTGKSTLASCIGREFGIPVHLIYLNGQTDASFIQAWDSANSDIGCPKVILIEDIDNIFNKREPIHATCELSFDTLLNKISGVSSMENVILIITTNRIEYVDEAIGQETVTSTGEKTVTRPGRIERIVHLGPMDAECRRGLVSSILDEDYAQDVQSLVDRSEGMTCAQVKDLCTKYCTQKLKEELGRQ